MRIKVIGIESDVILLTGEMPVLPRKGECIGFWDEDKDWVVAEVLQLVYEFEADCDFHLVEITVKY